MYAEFKYKAWYVDFIFETTAATGGSCTLPGVQQKLIRQRRIQPTSWSTTHRMAELVQSLSHHIYEMYTRHDSLWACTHATHAPSRHYHKNKYNRPISYKYYFIKAQVLAKRRKLSKVVQCRSVSEKNAIESKGRETTVNRGKTRLEFSQTHKKRVQSLKNLFLTIYLCSFIYS